MAFVEKLRKIWADKKSLVCVGLDPELSKLPQCLRVLPNPFFEFNRQIIDATAEFACAFKPQIAYYAAQKAEDQLEMTLDYIRSKPDCVAILDSKRGDIGSTAEMYAQEAFDRYAADAVTVNPYLGGDSLEPFLKRKDKGVVLLCRTSNPGAHDLQDFESGGEKLYQRVARLAVDRWNKNENVLLVVGATYPKELGEIRSIVGDMPILVPGVGAQGGDVEAVVLKGKDSMGKGLLISASRSIIYASSGKDFASAARSAAALLNRQINQFL